MQFSGVDYGLIERLVRENLEIDFACNQPNVYSGNGKSDENSIPSNGNPDIDYINALCNEIEQKIDTIQKNSSNLSQNINCDNIIKEIITTLMNIDTQCDFVLGDINATSDIENNIAINNQSTQGFIIGGNQENL